MSTHRIGAKALVCGVIVCGICLGTLAPVIATSAGRGPVVPVAAGGPWG